MGCSSRLQRLCSYCMDLPRGPGSSYRFCGSNSYVGGLLGSWNSWLLGQLAGHCTGGLIECLRRNIVAPEGAQGSRRLRRPSCWTICEGSRVAELQCVLCVFRLLG